MTTLRIVTDINVSEVPSDDVMEKVAESVRHYADGVLPGQYLDATDKSLRSTAHVHNGSDYRCDTCVGQSTDGVS